MSWKKNVFTDKLDYYEKDNFKGASTVPPSNPKDGWMYIDYDDNVLYIYYAGTWQAIVTLIGSSKLLTEASEFILFESGENLIAE